MASNVLGLDIGGANLKAAHSDGTARTLPFALWKQPERLSAELANLCSTMPRYDRLAITMTGELCDCFATRREGVIAILQAVRSVSESTPIAVWCTQGRFLDFDEAMANPSSIAAANWLALAHFVAGLFPNENALLIDTGSTTTDIVYLNHGKPEPRGLTDRDRLASGELVYTGVRRTPICAVLGDRVAAEFFATMLDAYVYAGSLAENCADQDTADSRPMSRLNAHGRLARMLCADAETFSEKDAHALAELALQTQWLSVQRAIERVSEQRPPVDRYVVSGSGEILGRSVCARYPSIPVASLAELLGPALSEAACAYAVARLSAGNI